jgi:glycosyltransferase involved in cell wall biosynthesis
MEKKNIAVVASRLKCVDAVSVEAEKWIDKYVKLGYNVHLIAGKFGEPVSLPRFELPEMDYKHPEVRGVKRIAFSAKLDKDGKKAAEILLNSLVKRIKGPLKNYLLQNKIQILSIEDALGSMKNMPLNIAMRQIVDELRLPTISRYHYIPWENQYFEKFDNFPKLFADTPPKLKNVVHVTNTETARAQLAEKRGLAVKVIPNTMDLEKLHTLDDYNRDFRQAFGIRDDQLIFLQPTRVKRNKQVEKSIKIVSEINDIMKKDNVLLITGSPVYSRGNYFEEVVQKMKKQNVNVIFANDRIFLGRHQNPEQKFYSIHDAYLHADVVLYPNDSSAFGNPVIEAVAYKKPLVVNVFPNLKEFTDKGFKFVVMDQKVNNELVSDLYELILNKEKAASMAENNYELLQEHYSSEVLDKNMLPVLNSFEHETSLISKVVGWIPKPTFWGSRQQNTEKFKAKNRVERHKPERKERDLRNKKGGYKEPVKR